MEHLGSDAWRSLHLHPQPHVGFLAGSSMGTSERGVLSTHTRAPTAHVEPGVLESPGGSAFTLKVKVITLCLSGGGPSGHLENGLHFDQQPSGPVANPVHGISGPGVSRSARTSC